MNDSMVEIIWIALALILQLVEEVEDVEGKCRRRTFDRRRKPAGTKELDTSWGGVIATTVTDDKTMNAGQVEYH